MNNHSVAKSIMKKICNKCRGNCNLCRLAQWDRAIELFLTENISQQEAVNQTEREINWSLRDITDKYDARHNIIIKENT